MNLKLLATLSLVIFVVLLLAVIAGIRTPLYLCVLTVALGVGAGKVYLACHKEP